MFKKLFEIFKYFDEKIVMKFGRILQIKASFGFGFLRAL